MKLLPFLLFYSFPMSIKIWAIRFIVSINLKDKVKRWLHFWPIQSSTRLYSSSPAEVHPDAVQLPVVHCKGSGISFV